MNAKAAARQSWSADRRSQNRAALERARIELLRDAPPIAPAEHPKRIAVLGLGGIGGSGKVAADTARGLAEAGHDVVYVSGPRPAFGSHAPNNVIAAPVPAQPPQRTDAFALERLTDRLVELFDSQRTELVFVHYCAGLLPSCLAARERAAHKPAVVAVVHGTDITAPDRSPEEHAQLKHALAQADDVVAVSGWLAREAKQRGLVADHRPIRVIENSIDVERFRPGRYSTYARSEFAADHQLLLVHVSNMRPVKRAPDTVSILAVLRDHGVDARLLAIGDGPEARVFDERLAALGLEDATRTIPRPSPDTLPTLMAIGDLSLVTSASESFSLAAMESMACGVPVVCGACGGLPEILSRLPGVGAPPDVGDIDGLAAACMQTLEDGVYGHRQLDGLHLAIRDFPRHRQVSQYASVIGALTGT